MPKKPTYEELEQRVKELEKESLKRKRAEEALRESEERFRLLFDRVFDAIVMIDEKGQIADVNQSTCRLLGYTKEELLKLSVVDIHPSEEMEKIQVAVGRVLRAGIDYMGETGFIAKDGRIILVEAGGVTLKIAGKIYIIGSFRDITERKRAEEELRQSEEHYRGVVEGSIQGIVIARARDSTIQFANQAVAKMFGYASLDELVGKNLWETLVEPEEWPELQSRAATLLSGKSIPIHPGWKGIRKDGSRVWIQTTASLISWQGEPAVLGFYADITELKQAEEALRESEEKYRTLVENVPVAVYRNTPGPKGRVLMANPTLLKMLGLESEEELKEVTVADVYMNPKDRKAFSDNLLAKGSVDGVELLLKKKDGTPFWGSVSARVVYDEGGKSSYFDCTIIDITAQKQAEEEREKLQAQLLQAQKVEAIGTLAGGIAHNFNNLLTGILGNTSLMLLETDPNHPYYERLKGIEKSVQSGSKLTYQLLGYARKGGYEIKPLSLNQMVKETSDTFAETKKEIRVHQGLAEDLFRIDADQGQIEQVLLNLYVNASDAMPGGGDLFLKTMNVTHEDMSDKLYKVKPGNYVLLTVRDTGIGMDKRTQEKIFDPFFTTKGMGRGTGLGLASVYGIVKAHGGCIDVESNKGHARPASEFRPVPGSRENSETRLSARPPRLKPRDAGRARDGGQGTTFSIYLPASSEKELIEEKQLPDKILKGKETILLVDDEDMIIDVGEEILKTLGYKVLIARGGKEAIELYKENRDKIDMVLLDMVMPDMGGGGAYDLMKEINPDIKVLLLSGYSIDGQATEILERGCNGFIQKPFNMRELSQSIRDVLDRK